MRPALPKLLPYAIILSGGFGVLQLLINRQDLTGWLGIFISFVFVAIYRRLLQMKPDQTSFAAPSKQQITLPLNATDTFNFFEGRPKGYAGYTDYTAMNVCVNDDLMARPTIEQYALLGFGVGLLEGIWRRLTEVSDVHRPAFRVPDASPKEQHFLGWLAYLQRAGTDNAGPSTENLRLVLQSVAAGVLQNGPVTMTFWDKVQNNKTESLETSATSAADLQKLLDEYQSWLSEGERRAASAIIA